MSIPVRFGIPNSDHQIKFLSDPSVDFWCKLNVTSLSQSHEESNVLSYSECKIAIISQGSTSAPSPCLACQMICPTKLLDTARTAQLAIMIARYISFIIYYVIIYSYIMTQADIQLARSFYSEFFSFPLWKYLSKIMKNSQVAYIQKKLIEPSIQANKY